MRRTYLLAFILAVLGFVVVTRTRFRPVKVPRPLSIPVVPAAPRPEPALPQAETGAKPAEPAAEAPRATGWLNVLLDLGGEPPTGYFRVSVFPQKGPIDLSEEYPGAGSIKIGPVPTGKKAVFVCPQSAPLGAVVALATVVEEAEVQVRIQLPKAFPIHGVVVDNTGRPVPEVMVDVEQSLPLEFRQSVEGEGSIEVGVSGSGGGGGMRKGYRGGTSHYSNWLGMKGIEFSFGAGTDSDGRFNLPYCTAQPTVTLKISRGKVLIKEESVIPSQGPLRLVIPVQAEDPKK